MVVKHSTGFFRKPQTLGNIEFGRFWNQDIAKTFGELSNLEDLNLFDCKELIMLRDSFGSLKHLKKLNLRWSRIKLLPESFGELSNLEDLDLDACEALFMLSDSFGSLKHLKTLNLEGFRIKNLP